MRILKYLLLSTEKEVFRSTRSTTAMAGVQWAQRMENYSSTDPDSKAERKH